MSDITTIWSPLADRGDWQMSGASLASGDDLVTAVLLSLFTDGPAHEDDVIPDGTKDRRGWWGSDGQNKALGSRLWLLERRKATTQTLNDARDYIKEALQWLIDDGVAAAVDVACEWDRPDLLAAQVTIRRANGETVALGFSWVWQGLS